MRGILADINARKHVKAIISTWASDTWREIWNHPGLSVTSFPALGLDYNSEKVAERLLEYLFAIDDFRGAVRIYVS